MSAPPPSDATTTSSSRHLPRLLGGRSRTPDPDAPRDDDALKAADRTARREKTARRTRVAKAVESWQHHLVDLGGRNTLLWYRDLPAGTLDLAASHPATLHELLAGRTVRLSELYPDAEEFASARRRCRVIRAKAVELFEERGISALFLTTGMATWTLPGTGRTPAAPVLLRPISIRPLGVGATDYELDVSRETEINPVLTHYLKTEHHLTIDGERLAELSHSEHRFTPETVYDALTEAATALPGFRVDARHIIGTFSYAKLPLVADLAAQRTTLAAHSIVAAMAGDPSALAEVRSAAITTGPPAADDLLVLDADSSQHAVINAVRAGASLVVKGPPGTGKSQTIANTIAALAADGKSVLFVAEKRAAIEAVVNRLDALGLDQLVLDVHDGVTNRKALAGRIAATLDDLTSPVDPALPDHHAERDELLTSHAQRLSDHLDALHTPLPPWGVTVHQAHNALTLLALQPTPPSTTVRFRGHILHQLTPARIHEATRQLAEAAELGAWVHDEATDPWFGATIPTAAVATQTLDVVSDLAAGRLTHTAELLNNALAVAGLPPAASLADWGRIFAVMRAAQPVLEVLRPEAVTWPRPDLLAATAPAATRAQYGLAMGWWERSRLVKEAQRLVRPDVHVTNLHEQLLAAAAVTNAWARDCSDVVAPTIPANLDDLWAVWDALRTDVGWLSDTVSGATGGLDLTTLSVEDLQRRCERWAEAHDRLAVLPAVVPVLTSLDEAGLTPLVADLIDRAVPPAQVAAECEYAWWNSILDAAAVHFPAFGAHNGAMLRAIADDYTTYDRQHVAAGAERVRHRVHDHLRHARETYPEEESLLRAEAGRSSRHKSLRDLWPSTHHILTAARPCWAMSPLVVASLLPPGQWFDVVVFDEASQVPPAQAVPALSRASRLLVAGDERQLPPTSFFTTASDDDTAPHDGEPTAPDPLTDGFESVLDVLAAILPVATLRWHYRSQDERLVAFANDHIYDGNLVTFPGVNTASPVSLVHVTRTDDLAGRNALPDPLRRHPLRDPDDDGEDSVTAEVHEVVAQILDHARRRPHETLGVITLGIRHAARIEDALSAALGRGEGNDVRGFFAEDSPSKFFIKNLERVQGDERDAIIVAIGYGRTADGRMVHRFGPLNQVGGERRLNVAITRARQRLTVVSSITAEDLDPARLRSVGARLLRAFLEYAARGGELPGRVLTARTSSAAQPLRTELAERLRLAGVQVREDYGAGEQRIDVVIADPAEPGRLTVAVCTDGPSAALLGGVRDRERLYPEQLRRLGWRTVRVATTDLFRDPAAEVQRILSVVSADPHAPEDEHVVRVRDASTLPTASSRPGTATSPPRMDVRAREAQLRRLARGAQAEHPLVTRVPRIHGHRALSERDQAS